MTVGALSPHTSADNTERVMHPDVQALPVDLGGHDLLATPT